MLSRRHARLFEDGITLLGIAAESIDEAAAADFIEHLTHFLADMIVDHARAREKTLARYAVVRKPA